MPPHKTVPKLQCFAKDKTLFNICAVILDEIFFGEDENWEVYGPPKLSLRLSQVRDILRESLSPSVLEDLLNTILERDEAIEATVRYLALQLLLVEGVRTLAVGNFPESYYSLVLEATARSGYGLHNLDLRGLWAREEHKNSLIKVLRRLADIKRLTLRYTCDDEMLATLGKYCNHLQKLDVAGARKITESGLTNLCFNPSRVAMDTVPHSLQIVDIGGPGSQGLPPSLASYLLLNLPHLVSLGSYEHTGAAVELVLQSKPGTRLSLRYLHDTITSAARYHAIAKACPMMQAVYLDSPKNIAVHNLDMLKHLREVKLHKVRWDDVRVMVLKIGTRIRSLFLLSVFGEIDMVELGRMCPQLQRLEIHGSALACSQKAESCTIFQELQELLIYTSRISSDCVKQLLSKCVATEHVALGECELTDAGLTLCLINNGLNKVKDLWLGLAQNLTLTGVEALLEHCPHLTSLGNLAAWSVHPANIDILRVQMLLNNADFTIHEIGPGEDQWIPLVDV